jgi:predicted nucleic acid-binding protein
LRVEVLDTSGMIAYIRDEPGGDVVERLLLDPNTECMAHAVNLCEVFYAFLRSEGEAVAQGILSDLQSLGLQTRKDIDPFFCQTVGRLKVNPGRISLADCFLIALAQRVGGEVVTADHHEFDRLVPLGLCPIRFIR